MQIILPADNGGGCATGSTLNPKWLANRCSDKNCSKAQEECCLPNEGCKEWTIGGDGAAAGTCPQGNFIDRAKANTICADLKCEYSECCSPKPTCNDWPCVSTFYHNKQSILDPSSVVCSGTEAPWCSDAQCCVITGPTGRLPEINKWPLYQGEIQTDQDFNWIGPPTQQQQDTSQDIQIFDKRYTTDIRDAYKISPNAL